MWMYIGVQFTDWLAGWCHRVISVLTMGTVNVSSVQPLCVHMCIVSTAPCCNHTGIFSTYSPADLMP